MDGSQQRGGLSGWVSSHPLPVFWGTLIASLIVGIIIGAAAGTDQTEIDKANSQRDKAQSELQQTQTELEETEHELAEAEERATKLEDALLAGATNSTKKKASTRPASSSTKKAVPSKVSIPDLVDERLDVAEDELKSKGLRYTEIGGGTFGIVVPANWTVCETKPAAGTEVGKGSRVKLIVDREC